MYTHIWSYVDVWRRRACHCSIFTDQRIVHQDVHRFTEESLKSYLKTQLRASVLLDLPELSSGETAIGLRQDVLIRLGTFLAGHKTWFWKEMKSNSPSKCQMLWGKHLIRGENVLESFPRSLLATTAARARCTDSPSEPRYPTAKSRLLRVSGSTLVVRSSAGRPASSFWIRTNSPQPERARSLADLAAHHLYGCVGPGMCIGMCIYT